MEKGMKNTERKGGEEGGGVGTCSQWPPRRQGRG